jgi:hypothetical protein
MVIHIQLTLWRRMVIRKLIVCVQFNSCDLIFHFSHFIFVQLQLACRRSKAG